MVVLNGANDNFLIQKKYYDFALMAFLRSESALKIPVRKKYFVYDAPMSRGAIRRMMPIANFAA